MKTAAEYKTEGNTAFGQKKFEEAIEHFTRAIEIDANDPVFYSNRSACFASIDNFENALKDAEKCIEINRTFIKGYSRKAFALFKLNRKEEALKVLNEGLEIDPSNEQLLKDREKMEESDNIKTNDLMNILNNPTIQKLMQDNPQLIQQFLSNPQLLKQFASNPNFAQMFGSKENSSNFQESKKQTNDTKQEDSQKDQEEKVYSASTSEFDLLKIHADKLYKDREFSEAIEKYDECIKKDFKNMLVRNNKAACLIELKEYKKAHEIIDQAIEQYRDIDYSQKSPAHLAKLYARKGRIYALEDNIEEAINAYQSSLLEDNNPQVESNLKQIKKTKSAREKEAYLNPSLADEHREKGNEYFKNGDFGKALQEYEEASRRNPNDAKIYNNRASCFIKILNYQQALLEVEKALKIDPLFVKALIRKASIHRFLKEYHKAISTYESVLKIEPANIEAKKGITDTNIQISQSMNNETDEQRVQRAMADPEIAAIVSDPMIRIALEQMQQNPRNINEYMKDSNLGPKIVKLIQAGIVRTS